jgi:O-antigen biosynthesis protein
MIPKVSILISVRDQLKFTQKCLSCLEATLDESLSFEVLIANDGSIDETREFLNKLSKPYRVFHRSHSCGFGKNHNWLADNANGEYLLFLNNDAFVSGNWFKPMLSVFKNQSNVGFVGNVQRLAGTRRFDHMGVVFSPLGNPRHYGQGFLHRPFKGEVRSWSAVTAACCLIKSSLFRKYGGFDESFVNGCEDVDLCLRLNREGFSHFVVHDSVIDHIKGATTGRKDRNDENFQLLMKKWGSSIRENESIRDSFSHARTYLYRPFFKPFGTNIKKFLEALLIIFRLRRLTPP